MNNYVRKYLVLIKKINKKKSKPVDIKIEELQRLILVKTTKKHPITELTCDHRLKFCLLLSMLSIRFWISLGRIQVYNKCSEFAPALIHPWGSWVLWFSEPFAVPYWQREQDFSGTKLKRIKPMVVTQTSCGSFIQRLLFLKKTSLWRWGTLRRSLRENFSLGKKNSSGIRRSYQRWQLYDVTGAKAANWRASDEATLCVCCRNTKLFVLCCTHNHIDYCWYIMLIQVISPTLCVKIPFSSSKWTLYALIWKFTSAEFSRSSLNMQ